MKGLCLELDAIRPQHAPSTGGKAYALAHLLQHGFSVPGGFCITSEAYRRFLTVTSLGERIRLELSRKDFREMRWEELWDASLRIRHLFSSTRMPRDMESELTECIQKNVGSAPVAVRSSAIGEDSGELSFAGLHESALNVIGTNAVLEQTKRVWASLWSDAALLYRKELGLEVEQSAMAVLVQRFVPGTCSGVAFSRSPLDPDIAVIEAVPGLAKGLVDGTVAPERWEVDRETGSVRSHTVPGHLQAPGRLQVSDVAGAKVVPAHRLKNKQMLSRETLLSVYRASRKAESLFGSPQDVEWTFDPEGLKILQSRPVTAKKEDTDTKRVWNLSLRRSFQNLQELREKIEGAILPEMKEEADRTAEKTLVGLTEQELAEEIEARASALEQWTRVYWDDLIPFAHGMRLFGQVYNDAVQPQDPFAFVALLRPERLESTDRNLMILRMAEHLRSRPGIRSRLADRNLDAINDPELQEQVAAYRRQYGNLLGIRTDRNRLDEHLRNLLLEMSDPAKPLNFPEKKIGGRNDTARLESDFLNRFEKNDREQARELLELGRASYRIRDDDNIYLDRFKALLSEAEEEGGRRLQNRGLQVGTDIPAGELVRALRDRAYRPRVSEKKSLRAAGSGINARQMLGQPAGHGIATGRARVITQDEELFSLRKGEILVCDAIDPAMTFVAPLAAGIVERRGGMLIHGAIIAREYGIPCVTGIPAATERIVSGDQVTVDGYLGIVVIESRPEGPGEPAGTLSA